MVQRGGPRFYVVHLSSSLPFFPRLPPSSPRLYVFEWLSEEASKVH
jgi:hypothetical protein